ncbi:MAG: hypothetical protein O3B70_02770 [Bacteroidetes bacterium]|nr:hypothetical protein [Bacteroidota bacterium]MDA0903232.1 hypothetical protein [Bacteroidota bacterium]MDA1242209.1 hypothetical protein [Bacteroidota bacterium]
MSRLALIWDGTWLRWSTFTGEPLVGRREVRKPDMIVEVLRALRNQVGAGASVVHTQWGVPSTVMPSALLQGGESDGMSQPIDRVRMGGSDSHAVLTVLHEMHHGPSALGKTSGHWSGSLTSLKDEPAYVVGGDVAWHEGVAAVFPQARHVPWVQVLLQDALSWQRTHPAEGWVIRVDTRPRGALFVGIDSGALQWVHHVEEPCNEEDGLYAIVNAVHRAGASLDKVRVIWSGDVAGVQGWNRFIPHVQAFSSADRSVSLSEDDWVTWCQTLISCA